MTAHSISERWRLPFTSQATVTLRWTVEGCPPWVSAP